MIKTIVIGLFVGLALGTFITLLTLAVSSILAFARGIRIDIPGVFSVWADDSTGSAGLAFLPNFVGIALMIGVIAALCAAVAAFARARAAAR